MLIFDWILIIFFLVKYFTNWIESINKFFSSFINVAFVLYSILLTTVVLLTLAAAIVSTIICNSNKLDKIVKTESILNQDSAKESKWYNTAFYILRIVLLIIGSNYFGYKYLSVLYSIEFFSVIWFSTITKKLSAKITKLLLVN
jgi:hypothetical protein